MEAATIPATDPNPSALAMVGDEPGDSSPCDHWGLGDPWMKTLTGLYTLSGGRREGGSAPRRDGRLELLAELIQSSFALLRSPLVVVLSLQERPERWLLRLGDAEEFKDALGLALDLTSRCQRERGFSRRAEVEAVLKGREAARRRIREDFRALGTEAFAMRYALRPLSQAGTIPFLRGQGKSAKDLAGLVYLDGAPKRRLGRPRKVTATVKGDDDAHDDLD